MELQASVLPASTEIQIVSAFILVILSSEILLVFISYRQKNPGSSALWIRIFIICTGELIVSYAFELIVNVFIDDPIVEQLYVRGFNLLAFDIECVLLFETLHGFNIQRKRLLHAVTSILAGLYIAISCVHLIEFISMNSISILPSIASSALLLPAIIVPLVVVAFLQGRAEFTFKRYYHAIIIAILMLGVGEVLRLASIQRVMNFTSIPDRAWIVSSVVLRIPGTALLLLAFYFMPYIEDLDWERNLMSIYVLETYTKAILFKELFSENIGIESRYSGTGDQERALLSSITGLDDFVSEVIKSPGGNLEFIDKGGIKFMFNRRKNLLFVITAKKNRPEIKAKLAEFSDWFFIHFGELAKNNVVDPEQYVKAHDIVSDVFRRKNQ